MTEFDNVLRLIRAEGEPPNTGEFTGAYPGEAGFDEQKDATEEAIDEQGDFTGGDIPGGGGGGGEFGGGGLGGPESSGGPEGGSGQPQQQPQGKDYTNLKAIPNEDMINHMFDDNDIDYTRLKV